MNEFDEKL